MSNSRTNLILSIRNFFSNHKVSEKQEKILRSYPFFHKSNFHLNARRKESAVMEFQMSAEYSQEVSEYL